MQECQNDAAHEKNQSKDTIDYLKSENKKKVNEFEKE